MADKLEREYNIPLRKEWLKVPFYKRAKKATTAVREFLQKHMKTEDINISQGINRELWKHGIKNPPHHVKVVVVKENNKASARLVEEQQKTEAKEEKKKEASAEQGQDQKKKPAEKKTKEKIAAVKEQKQE